jgi:signal transduction histidine kinase
MKAGHGSRPALWLGALLSLLVGLLFYVGTSKSIEYDTRERFAGYARNGQIHIGARIKSYSDLLRGANSLFQTADPVTRKQFGNYVRGVDMQRNFPAVVVINYARAFPESEREHIDAMMRQPDMAPADGTPFRIKPPGRRDNYAPLIFVEPMSAGSNGVGLDLHAAKHMYQTFTALRDTGALMTSGMPIAPISTPNNAFLAIRLAHYRRDMPTATVEQRRAAYQGSVGIAFSVAQLVQGVLDGMPVRNVRMTLVDEDVGIDKKRGRVLFDTGAAAAAPASRWLLPTPRYSSTVSIDFNGRRWSATFSTDKRNMTTDFEEYFPWLAAMAGFSGAMLIFALFHALSSSRRRAIKLAKGMTRELRDSQSKLQLSHHNLRRLAAHADQIKEGERKRIAREIHDDLGQNLLALRIEADMLMSRTSARHPRLHARARSTLSQIDATIKSVRQIINDLRPNVLDLGLVAAVEWQIVEFRRRNEIECELIDDTHELTVPDHCATAFFRILQESLSNIVRHAHATKVQVTLRTHAGQLAMTVHDNGVGLHADNRSKAGSFGLVGIEERVSILDGTFAISGMPNEGTTVRVSVPLQHVAPPSGSGANI